MVKQPTPDFTIQPTRQITFINSRFDAPTKKHAQEGCHFNYVASHSIRAALSINDVPFRYVLRRSEWNNSSVFGP